MERNYLQEVEEAIVESEKKAMCQIRAVGKCVVFGWRVHPKEKASIILDWSAWPAIDFGGNRGQG